MNDFLLGTVTDVSSAGVKILFDGHTTGTEKRYKQLITGITLEVDDRIVVTKIAGSYVVLGRIAYDQAGGSGITIDDELSTTSENPVQNKVITNALSDKADASDLSGKVDKAGDTMTGELLLDGSNLSNVGDYFRYKIKGNKKTKAGQTPAIETTANIGGFQIYDKDDNLIFYNQASLSTSQERIYTSYIIRRLLSDNTLVSNGFYIGVNNDGSAHVSFSGDGQTAWVSALGLSTVMKREDTAETTSIVADIATAGTDCSITSADFAQYGKIAQLRLVVKRTTAVSSGNTTMATLVAAKCPIFNTFATTHTNQGTVAYINANGNVVVNGPISANQSITIYSTYILP